MLSLFMALGGILIGAGTTGYVMTSKKSKVEKVVEDVVETVDETAEAVTTDEVE